MCVSEREIERERERERYTSPPWMPMPVLFSFKTLREKQTELVSSLKMAWMPAGPKALWLRSSSTNWAFAAITASLRVVWENDSMGL